MSNFKSKAFTWVIKMFKTHTFSSPIPILISVVFAFFFFGRNKFNTTKFRGISGSSSICLICSLIYGEAMKLKKNKTTTPISWKIIDIKKSQWLNKIGVVGVCYFESTIYGVKSRYTSPILMMNIDLNHCQTCSRMWVLRYFYFGLIKANISYIHAEVNRFYLQRISFSKYNNRVLYLWWQQ